MIVACIHLHSSFKFRKWLQLLSSILREPKFYHLLVCWRWASSDTPHDDLVTHRQLTSQSCHWPHCDVQHISTSLYVRPHVSSLCHTWPYCDLVYIHDKKYWQENWQQKGQVKHQASMAPVSQHRIILSMAHLNNYLRKLASSAIWLPPTPDELRIWSKQWTNQTCWAYFNLSM